MITALAGGVGAARFLTGLSGLVKQEDLSVIVNTGDDIELFGLHISPDIDIVAYTLAGIINGAKGWGIRNDTFQCLNMLGSYGLETWFNLGDIDLATHIYRTNLLRKGKKLSEVTAVLCEALGLKLKLLPMTDDRFETKIKTRKGIMHFEEYLVKHQAQLEVLGVEFAGVDKAKATEGVFEAIFDSELVVVCPSNPIVSIGTILSVEGVREALNRTKARVVGISPIVCGAPIKGPADKLLRPLGVEVSAFGVAKLYEDFLDCFVIDQLDVGEKERIEALGMDVKVANTLMKSFEDKLGLAYVVLEA